MAWFVPLAALAVIFGFASVSLDTWRAFREKTRSIATAIAVTCMVGGAPILLLEDYFERQGLSTTQHVFQVVGLTLFFGAGILGAIGLIWDRRMDKY